MIERRAGQGVLAVTLAGLLAGCATAPAYHPPLVAAPAAWHESGPWAEAQPLPPGSDTAWWKAFNDPELDRLEAQVMTANPTLAGALARRDEAAAVLRGDKAAQMPTLDAGATPGYDRQSDDRPLRGSAPISTYGANTADLSVGYEVDLWGRVRNSVAAGRARAEASADDIAAIRLSLEADLASDYIALRGLDEQADLLEGTVEAYARADAVVRARFAGGVATGIDTGRSGAILADAQAQLANVRAGRARLEHAIASLIGIPASSFAIAPTHGTLQLAHVPVGVPSTLLERRPDVAAAERRVLAANREIGVARSAFFPSLGLGATVGTQATTLGGLAMAPNTFWAIGPSMALNLFDGGKRRAAVASARARWAEAVATYRQTALGAFQQVEDGLSSLHHLGDQEAAERRAATAARQAADLSMVRYTKGAANYLDVVTAETSALTSERNAIDAHVSRLTASVALVRALGGGWEPVAMR